MTLSFTPPNEWSSPGDWADAYRTYGLAVLPATLSDDGKKKHPLGGWKEFQDNGIPQPVHDRWYKVPYSQQVRIMGFLTGKACFDPATGLLVIDVDVKDGKGGLATWHGWLAVHNNGMDIETWTARTGSGGLHYYFRVPVGRLPHNTQEKVEGIDVRGIGGFIMAPPSPHYLPGKEYEWLDGCAPWETEIAEAPEWLLDIAHSLSEVSFARTDRVTKTDTPTHCEDVFGNTIDGRDKKLADHAYRAMLDAYRLCPIKPPLAELEEVTQEAFETYLRTTESRIEKDGRPKAERLEAEGRGISAFREKIARHYRTWETHLAKAARSVPRHVAEKKLQDEHGRRVLAAVLPWMKEDGHPDAEWLEAALSIPFAGASSAGAEPRPPGPLEVLSEADLDAMPPPRWLVEDFLFEDAWGYLWGMPGTGKSFVALDLAAHVAYGMETWHHGKRINVHGDVLYLVQEGVRGFGKRLAAFRKHHGLVDYSDRIRLIRTSLNFMDAGDIAKLIETIKAEGRDFKLIVVDTFSRVLPGAEENAQEDMTVFIAASNKVREVTSATLLGVHHANFTGERERGSTTMRGAADFVFQVSKTAGDMAVEITCNKMKDDEDGWKKPFRLERVELATGSLGVKTDASLVLTAITEKEASAALNPIKAAISDAVQRNAESGVVYQRSGQLNIVSGLRKLHTFKGITAQVLSRAVTEMESEGDLKYGRFRCGNGVRVTGFYVAGTVDEDA